MAYPVQPVEFLDVGNALLTGANAGAQFQRSQLLREEDQQRKAAAQFIDPALKGDVTAMGRLIAGDPRAATAVGNTTTQMAARQKETRAEQLQFANDTIAGLDGAPEADRATVYAQRRAEAQARGWPVTMWPQQYSPSWHAIEKSRIIGVTEQWKAERARELKQLPSGGTAPDTYVPGPGANAAPTGGGTSTAGLREPIAAVVADARTVNPNLQLASAYRSQAVNTAAGGARDSQHMHGNAVDIPLGNMPPEQQQALVARVLSDPRVNGFGYYPGTNSIHVDTRSGPRTAWGADQTTRTVGQGWPAWMMPLVGQWQGGGRRADAGGETPMPGQEPSVGAPQGVQQASYEPPQAAPAMRPENTVYNDGQGRAEPGGPVLGPQPQPDVVDPNIVQAQAQAPPQSISPQQRTDLQGLINQYHPGNVVLYSARTGLPQYDAQGRLRVMPKGGNPQRDSTFVDVPKPSATDKDQPFGSGENGLAMGYLVRGKTDPEWLKDPRNAALYDMAYRRVSRGETRIQVIDGQQVPVTIQPLDMTGYPVPPGMAPPAASSAPAPSGQTSQAQPAQPGGQPSSKVTVGTSIGASEKPLTEFQSKSAGFHTRMTNAEKAIEQFTESGLQPGGALARNVPFAGNFMQSEDYQRFDRARRDFVNAVLRLESGSAIGQDEFASAERQYFPMPGDKPGVIEDKRIARHIVTEAMKISAGPAGMRQATPNAPPASEADAEKERQRLKQKYNLK